MRYLITGAGGFIGTHLAQHLLDAGHQVTGVDPHRCDVRGVHHVYGSAADPRLMGGLIPRHDGVFHLAAVVGFAKVMPHLVQTVTETTSSAATVFAIASQSKTRTLFTSTSAVYGRGNGHPAKETDDALVGPSPVQSWSYAYAKAAAECLAFGYVREAGAPFIVTRVFNTVGPGQSAEAGFVLPRFCRQAATGDPMTVYAPGTQRRTFCHVQDVVRGLTELMECDKAVGELVNVGGTVTMTMRELAEVVKFRARSGSLIETCPPPYKHGYDDIESRKPDLTKIAALIDYVPVRSVDDMVDDVLAEVKERKLVLV
jgi:Nucleoside-diphosphate-sugar epimerases